MRVLLVGLVVVVGPAWGEGWVQRGGAFACSAAGEEILFPAPGTVEIGPTGGPYLSVAFFMWHDDWVYERLERGTVTEGPAVDARGRLVQTGTWGTTEGAPALRYTLVLEPQADVVLAHLEIEKTADLKITNGLWCNVSYDNVLTEGKEVYLRPTTHGPLGKPITGECDALLIGLGDGQAASFSTAGFLSVRGGDWPAFEVCLRPGDFPTGERVRLDLNVGVEKMPTEFPGEIVPSREPLAIRGVRASAETVPLHGLLELDVDLGATWDNPFDPDDVALDAEIMTASERIYQLPGFYRVESKREVRGGSEMMIPTGKAGWLVRIAATEVGPLRCKLTARDRTGAVTREAGEFTVTPSTAKGFLRQSPVDAHYLAFESGAPFFPIGHNLPVYHTSGQTGEDAIRKMAAAGENYNRWWMSNAGFGIEWGNKIGWYRQPTASRVDAMLDLAAELNFCYMMCFDTHQDFLEGGWAGNPYNKANGGPCATPGDWFRSGAARLFYTKRLRYIVARWAWSPNVLCWEFGNEFEGWPDAPQDWKIEWHRVMTKALADLDPYDHPITTSWWSQTGPEECWRIPGMDIVQTHCYTNNDANVADQIRGYCLHQWEAFEKPHIFGEFGIRSHTTTEDKDPKGWALHNAYWAAMCSGACGIAMPWWHENYIDPLDLYFHFTAVRNFVADLPFGTARWEQTPVESVEYVSPPNPPIVSDIVVAPVSTWGKAPASEITVGPDGSVSPQGAVFELLHGSGHEDLRNPPTFTVDYPRDGKFIITVGRVSNSGLLRVWIDDKPALERDFPCGENHGKEWVYQQQWNLWESQYDEDVSVDVPAGKHRIKVDNLGKDWMRIAKYVFTGCRVAGKPNLLVAALSSPDVTIVWMQNRESDWYNHGRGPVAAVPASRITLSGFADGEYDLEWWSTWKGEPGHRERVRAEAGRLTLDAGEVATDVAVKVRKAG